MEIGGTFSTYTPRASTPGDLTSSPQDLAKKAPSPGPRNGQWFGRRAASGHPGFRPWPCVWSPNPPGVRLSAELGAPLAGSTMFDLWPAGTPPEGPRDPAPATAGHLGPQRGARSPFFLLGVSGAGLGWTRTLLDTRSQDPALRNVLVAAGQTETSNGDSGHSHSTTLSWGPLSLPALRGQPYTAPHFSQLIPCLCHAPSRPSSLSPAPQPSSSATPLPPQPRPSTPPSFSPSHPPQPGPFPPPS